jgi:hypothetical protein
MTIFKSFHKGDFPAGSYPQPSIAGSALSKYQVNAVKHWRDGTQTCTINSVTSGAEPTVSLSCPGSVVKEGELLTFAGNGSIPNGTYAIVGITSTNPLIGYLPAATSSGTSTTGSVAAPDYGSIMQAYITFNVTIPGAILNGTTVTASASGAGATVTVAGYTVQAADVNGVVAVTNISGSWTTGSYTIQSVNTAANTWTFTSNVAIGAASGMTGQLYDLDQVSYVSNPNPCYLGSQTTCDAAALTQTQMLGFNSSNWDLRATFAANNGTQSTSVDFRTMLSNGDWAYLIKGPLLTRAKLENLSTSGPAYDFGFRDLDTTVVTVATNATQTNITLADVTELSALTLPTNISVGRINNCNGAPEIMTVTAINSAGCAGANVVCVTRAVSGSTAQAFGLGSTVQILSAPAGYINSWQERPMGTLINSVTSSATTVQLGNIDMLSQIYPSGSFTALLGSEQVTVSGTPPSSCSSGSANQTVTRAAGGSTATAHAQGEYFYASGWPSNWQVVSDAAHKGNHPVGYVDFYTPDGVHQWPGVFEELDVFNSWFSKFGDQFYVLNIKTGGSLGTTKVSADRVPAPANTAWRRRFWDGAAPGGTDCPFGTQTGCGVAVDYNLSYLSYSGVIVPLDASTWPIASSEQAAQEAKWCTYGPASPGNYCSSGTYPAIASFYYTFPGPFLYYQPSTGGRQEGSFITRMDQAYLYSMDVTTVSNINTNLNLHEVSQFSGEAAMHWPIVTLDDSTTAHFDDLGAVPAFGHVISRDAHPNSQNGYNDFNWLASCLSLGVADCPTLIGITENILLSTNGGRQGDGITMGASHQNVNPWTTYVMTGDPFILNGVYQTGSNATRDSCSNVTNLGCGHGSWGLIVQSQPRGYGWMLGDLIRAAGMAPDNTPEERMFQQKMAFEGEASEGWTGLSSPNCYFCSDTLSTSKYQTGVAMNVALSGGVSNPLGMFEIAKGEAGSGGTAACEGSLSGTGYTKYSGYIATAPWQEGFIGQPLSLGAVNYGFTPLKFVRQQQAVWHINFVNYAVQTGTDGNIANYYFSTRAGSGNGTIPTCGSGSTAQNVNRSDNLPFATWTDLWANVCTSTNAALGCNDQVTPAIGRYNLGPAYEDETYVGIVWATMAMDADVDTSPCPLRSSGSLPCGLVTFQWLQNNVPLQNTFANIKEWDYAATTSAATPTCQFITTSLPGADTGVSYSQTIQMSGCAAPTFSVNSGSLPTWATLGTSTGSISGTPSGSTPTTSSFTIAVSDANGNPTLATSILDCTPPTITTTNPLANGSVGGAYSTAFAATGDATITWSATGLPAFLSLSSSGTLSGTPTGNGLFSFSVTAANSCGAVGPSAFSLLVNSGVRGVTGAAALNGNTTVH